MKYDLIVCTGVRLTTMEGVTSCGVLKRTKIFNFSRGTQYLCVRNRSISPGSTESPCFSGAACSTCRRDTDLTLCALIEKISCTALSNRGLRPSLFAGTITRRSCADPVKINGGPDVVKMPMLIARRPR